MHTLRIAPSLFAPVILLGSCADHDSGRVLPILTVAPAFETRAEILTGTESHADAALADFDGDAVPDLAVIGLAGELQVMIGNGNGTFSRGQGMQLGGDPIWMRSADLDGDQDPDLVVVRTAGQTARVLLNDGNANFTAGPELPVGDAAVSVVLGDANDDGLLDIIVSRLSSPQITVYVGDGNGSFTPGSSFVMPRGGSPYTMSVGEVTGNGHPDLVVCDQALERLLIYEGNTLDFDPVPMEVPVTGNPRAVSIGDLSGDGRNDMAVSLFDLNQLFVITDVTPVGVRGFTANVAGAPSLSTIADVTGDGRADLIAAVAGRASISIFVQSPGGGLQEELQMSATGLPLRSIPGDVDGDGVTDLVVLSGLGDRLNLFLGRPEGRLNGSRTYDSGIADAACLSGADFDGDGLPDLVTGGTGGTEVGFLVALPEAAGSPQRRLFPALQVDVGLPVLRVHAADLDRDDLPDVAVAVQGGVLILHNRSIPGTFDFELVPASGQPLAAGSGPFGISVADMNGDTLLDLVVADFGSEAVSVLTATGQGLEFTAMPSRLSVPGRPVDVATADFSGDGIPDVAVTRSSLAMISLYTNDGRGALTHEIDLPVGGEPTYLVTADLDRNGRADLVVSNSAAGTISVLFSRPGGLVQADFPAGRTPTALLAQDLTQDGLGDILVASLQDSDFRVLAGDGLGGFPAVFRFPGRLGASAAQLQDLNGDGLPELVLTSLLDSRVALIRNISDDPGR